ncbi:MAG: hypothetical protein EA393_02150 [Bacteroidetes bacterium]|nr:MAG: hypothetical protein EA393_02150 [Bacteroidota bacterium]
MKQFLIVVFMGLYATYAFSQVNDAVSLPDSVRETLAFELAQICAFDQGIRNDHLIRNYGKEITKLLPAVDSLNFDKFIKIVKEFGYPNETLLGKYFIHECVRKVGSYILLHNPNRLIEPEIYQLFRNEVLEGRLDAEFFALALDKYYVIYEKRSLHNSLFKTSNRLRVNGVCITDKELSDSLRLDIGLPPLEEHEFISE